MLNYIQAGNYKYKLIFVHGGSLSSKSWNKLFTVKKLAHNFSLIAVDLPGHGDSFRSQNNPYEDYSLRGSAAHLLEFLKKFEQSEYILIGNSLGANLIGEIAGQLKNCKGILLIGSTAFGNGLEINDILQPNLNSGVSFSEEYTDVHLNAMVRDCIFHHSDEDIDKIRKDFIKADPKVRSMLAESVSKSDFSDELSTFKSAALPVAFLYGKEEKLCYTDVLDKPQFPKWRDKVFIIPEAGHFAHLDQPEIVADIIVDFARDCLRIK